MLDDESFAIMVLITLFMTGLIVPLVSIIYKPSRKIASYKRRTIQTATKRESELRILTCIHSPINVPSIINLLQASHPSRKSPICVYVLHLVELTGRTSAMLIVHNTATNPNPNAGGAEPHSDHIISAFQNLELNNASGGVSVQPLTAISPYSTMHEDICNLAEDKRVAFIVIPFHKQHTVDGNMESTNAAFRTINQNLLSHSPCSVGILVDRGLTGASKSAVNNSQISHRILVLFFGGPDDREALSFAARMLDNPAIHLTVLRLLAGDEAMEQNNAGKERDRKMDENCVKEFKMRSDQVEDPRLDYIERVVNNGEETVAAIRSMNDVHDLVVCGRGQGIITPLTAGLTDWSECPELGAIGDLLASSDFATTASVLVVQQYIGLYGDVTAAAAAAENEGYEEYEENEERSSPMRRAQQMSVFRTEPGRP